jgi:antitoxin (DNA-binding transcriptional repressor) of toxin-antitoxin stability system
MAIFTISFAKAHLLQLVNRALRGEEIIIARGRKPVVRLVAMQGEQGDRKSGAWKGRITWTADAFAPLTEQELKDLGWE